eukprot:8669936-Karenia_brevis.AAC.1
MGPLLFAAALQPVLQKLRARSGSSRLDLVFSYLDDAVLAGTDQAVAEALQSLQQLVQPLGLRLNTSKCELVPA